VNYGVGNLRSVKKGLEKAGALVSITDNLGVLQSSEAIVLPGVGAFNSAIKHIKDIQDFILNAVKTQKLILGICLGLQILFTKSCEGGQSFGLDILKGEIIQLSNNVKHPQMGWNTLKILRDHPFLNGIAENSFVYFAHSFIPRPVDSDIIIATTEYGGTFPSIIAKKTVIATQFHPEKSGNIGQKMLNNFIQLIRR
jgi:glutamine amidotransferase